MWSISIVSCSSQTRPTVFMSILSHLSLTMVPLMIGIMFSQSEILREAWKRKEKIAKGPSSIVPVFVSQYPTSEDSVSQYSASEDS